MSMMEVYLIEVYDKRETGWPNEVIDVILYGYRHSHT